MKVLLSLLAGTLFLAAATTALAGGDCQKCTHDLQVQYRECLKSGKAQEMCNEQQQASARACIKICQKNKAPDEKP
ncbi:MAG TPA: hypothetical protein VK652_05705 [Steroidobacteraceae bacterium]|nr:hypothetical protein [Steroidobacteraceae bacterium]